MQWVEEVVRHAEMLVHELYQPSFVRALFDEMALSYGTVNLISSFGFNYCWRRQCLREVAIRPGDRVLDLMTGQGELLSDLARRVELTGELTGVDFSAVMCERARLNAVRRVPCACEVIEADVMSAELPVAHYDVVVSSFGLKTFSAEQRAVLAQRIHASLKPGGVFSLVEISVPPARWLAWPYLFYLRWVIPWVGALCWATDNYRLLGVYTAFGNVMQRRRCFEKRDLNDTRSYFLAVRRTVSLGRCS